MRPRAGRTVPGCFGEVFRSLNSGEEATAYLLASADRSPCPERCGIRELSLERRACEPAQATASSSRRRPALRVIPTPGMSVSSRFFPCARDKRFYAHWRSDAGYSKRATV
jgi:hypothetical protein